MKLPSYPGIFSEQYYERKSRRQTAQAWLGTVFLWMLAGLILSTATAVLFARNGSLYTTLLLDGSFRLFAMVTPLVFALLLSFGYRHLPVSIIAILYLCFATVCGISFAVILNNFEASSVAGCFGGCAAMFGVMAWMGYNSKSDLSRFGTLLRMALIGMIVALLINTFLGNGVMSHLVSIAGIAIFTGLTAYDMQKLRRIGFGVEYDDISPTDSRKLALVAAFTLYLDFINLFLMLLPGFGKRR